MHNLKDSALLRQQCYIDGAWVGADSGATIGVNNPATGEAIGSIPKMGAAETRRAIIAANAALPGWRAKTAAERGKLLRRWSELMLENQADLALIMTSEQGKPLAEARGEIAYAASYLEWFAEEGRRAYGEIIPPNGPDRRLLVTREPVGVCATITPWNFPAAMITRKAGAALAAGCTMIAKPATQTPFSALALAELAERAGIPKGVFSVVTGAARDIGGEICANPTVRKLSFTGSTATGKRIMRTASEDLKRVSLELGGKSSLLVLEGFVKPLVMGTATGIACAAMGKRVVTVSMTVDFIKGAPSGAKVEAQAEVVSHNDRLITIQIHVYDTDTNTLLATGSCCMLTIADFPGIPEKW